MKNATKPLGKCVLIPLSLTAAASAANTQIHKKILETTTEALEQQHLISNDQLENCYEYS